MKKYVNCYASGHGDHWQAVCLEFDLMVEGTSLEEVKECLNASVHSYLEDALREPNPADKRRLLTRQSPFLTRIMWTWPFVVAALFGQRPDRDSPDQDSSVGFAVACHV